MKQATEDEIENGIHIDYTKDRPAFSGKPAQESQLRDLIVGDVYETPVGDNADPVRVAEVTCPRTVCGETFIVVVAEFWRKDRHRSTPCVYCFKTALRGKRPTKRAV